MQYKVLVSKTFFVDSESKEDAEEKIDEMIRNGEIVLDNFDYEAKEDDN